MPPVAMAAAASEPMPMMALTRRGPPAVPRSVTSRQAPRNSPRPAVGEKSEPRVMLMPLPRPLPKETRRLAARRAG